MVGDEYRIAGILSGFLCNIPTLIYISFLCKIIGLNIPLDFSLAITLTSYSLLCYLNSMIIELIAVQNF